MTSIARILPIIIQLIFIEGILSIDNATILGALAATLPDDKPVPYPRPLSFLQGVTNRLLGNQQLAALRIGLLVAYAGRGLMLFLAHWISRYPLLQILGAAYLIKLAMQQLKPSGDGEAGVDVALAAAAFWPVVWRIELADLALSLDNVVTAVALSPDLWVVMLGVALGILAMRFAAGVFTRLIRREPILETAAYLIILAIGTELILSELPGISFPLWFKSLISAVLLLACVAYARLPFLQRLTPVLHGLGRGIGLFDRAIDRLFAPVTAVAKRLFRRLGDSFNRS